METALRRAGCSVALVALLAPVYVRAATRGSDDLVSDVRKELLDLPYYGVFDALYFSVNGPTVTLSGAAYNATLKKDAEREVRAIRGVENVVNNIEILPVSLSDDDIRWRAFRAIYRDASLSRYSPGGGWVPHGLMRRFDRPFSPFAGGRFPGQEPVGSYPIHIVVERGQITLIGVVDSEMDKTLATLRARGVSGAFGVTNNLEIDSPKARATGRTP